MTPQEQQQATQHAAAVQAFAKRIIALEQNVMALGTTPQLKYSSIEDGALRVNGPDQELRATIGKQADGTVATTYTNGPTPGAPAAPFIAAHQLAILVQWDGMFETGAVNPKDLSHVEVHVSETAVGGTFEPSLATLAGTIPPEGGALTVAGDNTEHFVCLRALSTSGVYGPPSDFQSVTPLPAGLVIGSELVGLIVTGGIVRTAASGPRVELNATESVQEVLFIGSTGATAAVGQQDTTDPNTGAVTGSGLILQSSAAAGVMSGISVSPDMAGLTIQDAATQTIQSQIFVTATTVELATPASLVYVTDTDMQIGHSAAPGGGLDTFLQMTGGAQGTIQLVSSVDSAGPRLQLSGSDATSRVSMQTGGNTFGYVVVDASGGVQLGTTGTGSPEIELFDDNILLSVTDDVTSVQTAGIQVSQNFVELQTTGDGTLDTNPTGQSPVANPYLTCFSDGTWAINGPSFQIFAPLDYYYDRVFRAQMPSPTLVLTTSAQDIPGTAITFTTTVPFTTVLVTATIDFSRSSTTAGTAIGTLQVDGVTQPSQILLSPTANLRITAAQTWMVTFETAGSHTMKLRAQAGGTGDPGCNVNYQHTQLSALIVSGG